MALRAEIGQLPRAAEGQEAILRFTSDQLAKLQRHVFQRYPCREWGTFFRFGYRRTSWGLALAYVEPLLPIPGDLDRRQGLTRFLDQYSRRVFQAAASGPLAVGVVHSHPEDCRTLPGTLDYDMDVYFAREFNAYSRGAPYCSLILQRSRDGELSFTGRVCDRGQWLPIETLFSVGESIRRWRSEASGTNFTSQRANGDIFRDRAAVVLGALSLERLASATVGIVGCSGSGSPAAHVLARGGVGGFVLVDYQRFDKSNLERFHGSTWNNAQCEPAPHKVRLVQDLVLSINPNAKVVAIAGNILQENVIDELLRCDVVIGGVDTQHGRAALSDLAQFYLLPSIDIGLLMSGQRGKVTEQLIEFNQWSPDLACAFCEERIDGEQMSYELMTEEERCSREDLAERARIRGDNPDAYWRRPRQLHTVGYLATVAGALAAGYVEGKLTGAFAPPHPTFQFDIGQSRFGIVTPPRQRAADCSCVMHLGWCDQAHSERNVSLPSHWQKRAILLARIG